MSVEQWMPVPATPATLAIPVFVVPAPSVLELDAGQRPENVSADRWTGSESANILTLFT